MSEKKTEEVSEKKTEEVSEKKTEDEDGFVLKKNEEPKKEKNRKRISQRR